MSAIRIKNDRAQSQLIEHYDSIRSRYQRRTMPSVNTNQSALSHGGGFYKQSDVANLLGERYADFEKLFAVLVDGMVDDPDYAKQKDSRIYERMRRDPQIFYCLQVRVASTANAAWTIRPRTELAQDKQALEIASAVEDRFRRIPRLAELFTNMLEALLPGLSINELVWQYKPADGYVISDHYPVSKDRMKFDRNGNMYLLQPKEPNKGIRVPPYKFIKHLYRTRDGSWERPRQAGYAIYGQGLADTPLYHYFYFKVTALRYMMRALERHGLPFKIYYTGNDADAVLSKKLDTILAALQNDSVVGIPGKKGDTDVDVIRTPSAINHFIEFIKYVDTLITRTILGQELMTEMPGGVNNGAAASVQRTVFGEISSIDRQQLAETITSTILEYDRVLNYPNLDVRYKPKFQFRSPLAADATQFLTTVQAAINLGLDVSEEQIREATALRQPANHETVVNLETINERKINLQPDRLGSEEEGMEESLGEQERKIQSGKDPSGKSTRSTTAQKTRGTSQKINEGRLSQSR